MIKKSLISILGLIALSACAPEYKNSWKMYNKDHTKTIAGIDKNNNGIRDDIDVYIEETYPGEQQRKAVNQYAKIFQQSLFLDITNKDALHGASIDSMKSVACIYDKIEDGRTPDGADVVQVIVSLTTNTRPRLEAYWRLEEAYNGFVFTLSDGDDKCDK